MAAAGRQEASLQQVRYWCSAKYTRVVFDLDREVEHQVGRLEKDDSAKRPARIYVDLRDTLGSKDVAAKMELAEGPVRSIRSGRFDKSTTRLVLDLRHAEDYNVFQLEEPFRIVLDLWWKKDGREQEGSRAGQGSKDASKAMEPRLPLIVIDPGHGGRDPGAVGRSGLKEKDVALGVARVRQEHTRRPEEGEGNPYARSGPVSSSGEEGVDRQLEGRRPVRLDPRERTPKSERQRCGDLLPGQHDRPGGHARGGPGERYAGEQGRRSEPDIDRPPMQRERLGVE